MATSMQALGFAAFLSYASAQYMESFTYSKAGCADADLVMKSSYPIGACSTEGITDGGSRKGACNAAGQAVMKMYTDATCTTQRTDAFAEVVVNNTCKEDNDYKDANGVVKGWTIESCAETSSMATSTIPLVVKIFSDDKCTTQVGETANHDLPSGCRDETNWDQASGTFVTKSEKTVFGGGKGTTTKYSTGDCSGTATSTESMDCGACFKDDTTYRTVDSTACSGVASSTVSMTPSSKVVGAMMTAAAVRFLAV